VASLEENRHTWGVAFDWADAEIVWSGGWGGPSGEWFGAVLPRLQGILPVGTAVEIGCGTGRWTEFLHPHCVQLIAVDISERCVDAARRRFRDRPNVQVELVDGRSLSPVGSGSADLVFSFDSLVHADSEVMSAYLLELSRVLTADGVALLHHSNLGAYPLTERIRRTPVLGPALARIGATETSVHWRDATVSAAFVAATAERFGLRCVMQELIPWDTRRLFIDCISTIVRQDSPRDRGRAVIRNRRFGAEAPVFRAAAAVSAPRETDLAMRPER
jgi:SAM-dependent methyltransferase